MTVDLSRAKEHLRVDYDDEDALIGGYLLAAKAAVEREAGVVLEERAVAERRDGFVDRYGSSAIRLAYGPVVGLTAVDYVDADGAAQTLTVADDAVRVVEGEPFLVLAPSASGWPATADQPGAVTVRYQAGYGGDAGDAPASLDQAVLMLTAHYYENREAVSGQAGDEVPLGVKALCWPFRRNLLG